MAQLEESKKILQEEDQLIKHLTEQVSAWSFLVYLCLIKKLISYNHSSYYMEMNITNNFKNKLGTARTW